MRCPSCQTPVVKGMNFCPTCGTPVAWASGAAAEVRESACLAAEVSGQAKLAGVLLPAQINGYVNACVRVIEDACVAYGGMVLRRYTTGVTAIFGAPVGGEREVERAVRAALTMRNGVEAVSQRVEKAAGTRLYLRCGVDFGPVRVSAFGGGAAFVTTGSPVNNAIELRAVARPSAIVVSAAAGAHVKEAFRLHIIPLPHAAPAAAGEAYEIAGLADGAEVNNERTPFVGRNTEGSLLRKTVDSLVAGRGGVVAFAGPAGIGKSRLCSEVLYKTGNPRVFAARCIPATAEGAYDIFREALEGILAEYPGQTVKEKGMAALGADNAFLADALPLLAAIVEPRGSTGAFPNGIPPEVLRERSHELVEKIITDGCRGKPSVLVFEDLQWMGSSGADILYRLCAQAPKLPLLLVLTARDAAVLELFTANVTTLAPLTDEETRTLLTSILPLGAYNEEFVNKAVKWAGGSPLYCEELAASVGEAGTGELDPPASVKAAVRARLDKLSPGALIVAKTAACFGMRAEISLLKEVLPAGFSDADGFLREVIDSGFVDIEAGGIIFRNEITRVILIESWVETDRARVWGNIAKAVAARNDDPATVAFYLTAAGRKTEAVQYLKEAGDRARGLFLMAEAVSYYERAWELDTEAGGVDKDLHFEIITELAEVLCETAAPARALTLLTDAFAGARNNAERARLFGLAGSAYSHLGDYRRSLLYLEDARRLYNLLGDLRNEGYMLRSMGAVYGRLGDNTARRKSIAETLVCFTEAEDDVGIAYCHNAIGTDYVRENDPVRALEFFKEALETWTRAGHLTGQALALSNIAVAERALGRYHLARDHLEQAVALNRRCGTRRLLASNLCTCGTVTTPLDPPRGEALFHESMALAEQTERHELVFANAVNLAEQYRSLGKWDRATAALARAQEEARILDSEITNVTYALAAAFLRIDRGDIEGPGFAQDLADVYAFETNAGTITDLWKKSLGVALARARGNAAEIRAAVAALEQSLSAVKDIGAAYDAYYHLGMGRLAIGLIDGAEDAFRWVVDHTEGWHKLEWPRALYGLALVARRRGDPGQAKSLLAQARDVFGSYDAGFWLDQIKAAEEAISAGSKKGK